MQGEPHQPHYEGCAYYECPTPPEFVIFEVNNHAERVGNHTHACSVHVVEVLREYLQTSDGALVGPNEPERCN